MRIMDVTALSEFARRTADSAFDFANVVHNLIMDVRDSYRPAPHDIRGPGSKWRVKHQPWQALALAKIESEAVPLTECRQPSPVHVRRRDATHRTRSPTMLNGNPRMT